MAQYTYSQLENVAVDIIEDAVSLNMKTSGPEEQRTFSFETEKKEDIASLIASYSPVHSNWKRVGEAKTKKVSDQLLTEVKLVLPFLQYFACINLIIVQKAPYIEY